MMTGAEYEEHLLRLAMGFVSQERFYLSRPDRAARLANAGSEQEDLWGEVIGEFIGCTAKSDELLILILRHHDEDLLALFGQGYMQPWVEKASAERLEWLAELVRTDERARRAISGVRRPPEARPESSLWGLIADPPEWRR
ncbi:MAG: hypothetical protein U1E24_14595 [Phenylobacterium sp.]|nr:hypothetical protein [Phenylobacterium sp.]